MYGLALLLTEAVDDDGRRLPGAVLTTVELHVVSRVETRCETPAYKPRSAESSVDRRLLVSSTLRACLSRSPLAENGRGEIHVDGDAPLLGDKPTEHGDRDRAERGERCEYCCISLSSARDTSCLHISKRIDSKLAVLLLPSAEALPKASLALLTSGAGRLGLGRLGLTLASRRAVASGPAAGCRDRPSSAATIGDRGRSGCLLPNVPAAICAGQAVMPGNNCFLGSDQM